MSHLVALNLLHAQPSGWWEVLVFIGVPAFGVLVLLGCVGVFVAWRIRKSETEPLD